MSGYGAHDPETGCAYLAIIGAVVILAVYLAVWWFFGLYGVVVLLAASGVIATIAYWWSFVPEEKGE